MTLFFSNLADPPATEEYDGLAGALAGRVDATPTLIMIIDIMIIIMVIIIMILKMTMTMTMTMIMIMIHLMAGLAWDGWQSLGPDTMWESGVRPVKP